MNTISGTAPEQVTATEVRVTDLSIIIVSWNTKKYMEEVLTSLSMRDGNLSAEIIVVDNASADGTPALGTS